jgi:hypothetical protein
MDREGASFEATAASIRRRLHGALPLPLQTPLGEASDFAGIVDLVSLEIASHGSKDGSVAVRSPLAAVADALLSDSPGAGGMLEVPGRAGAEAGAPPLRLPADHVLRSAAAGEQTGWMCLSASCADRLCDPPWVQCFKHFLLPLTRSAASD